MWLPLLAPVYFVPAVRRALDVPWEGMLLTALTLAMALTSRRFIPLFGISLAVMFAPLVALCLQKFRLEKYSPGLAVIALLFGLYRLLPYPTQSDPAFHYLTAEYSFPVEMLNFIEANEITGNVFALWNWGGYIHWRTDGGLKVFVDGRADTIYDDETYTRYVTALSSAPGWLELVEQSDADYILWPHSRGNGREKLRELVDSGRWRPIYSDAVSWLLVRKDAVPEREYMPSAPGPWRDLAMARNAERAGEREQAIYYAEKVRELMPWHKDACSLLIASHRAQNQAQAANELLADCLSYFPTAYLR
jgi:hypothetical protein